MENSNLDNILNAPENSENTETTETTETPETTEKVNLSDFIDIDLYAELISEALNATNRLAIRLHSRLIKKRKIETSHYNLDNEGFDRQKKIIKSALENTAGSPGAMLKIAALLGIAGNYVDVWFNYLDDVEEIESAKKPSLQRPEPVKPPAKKPAKKPSPEAPEKKEKKKLVNLKDLNL